MVGRDDALVFWSMGREAVRLVREIAARPEVGVPFHPGIVHADHRRAHVRETHAYAERLARDYGYEKIRPLSRSALREIVASPAYHGGALDEGGGHLDPLAYALGLARLAEGAGVTIHETSRVQRIVRGDELRLETDRAVVRAHWGVIGCNGYLGALVPEVGRYVMPINNFVAATEPLGRDAAEALIAGNRAVADSRFVVNYFRLSDDHRLLFGGGETYSYRFPRDIAGLVRKRMVGVFPQLADAAIDFAWGGTLAITRTRMPHFARVTPNLLSLSGYSGHGVAMASLAGRIAAETVAGQAERFDLMARLPQPRFPGGRALRSPLLALAMAWYAARDRL
jgi:gamma-glutamylputrescine oxidase